LASAFSSETKELNVASDTLSDRVCFRGPVVYRVRIRGPVIDRSRLRSPVPTASACAVRVGHVASARRNARPNVMRIEPHLLVKDGAFRNAGCLSTTRKACRSKLAPRIERCRSCEEPTLFRAGASKRPELDRAASRTLIASARARPRVARRFLPSAVSIQKHGLTGFDDLTIATLDRLREQRAERLLRRPFGCERDARW
jgi:hypothetical protein